MKHTVLPALLLLVLAAFTARETVQSWPAPNSPPVDLDARFWRAEAPGKRPAVVLLHGCAGWYGNTIDRWADWFVARGYHALALDSFESRGHPDGICASLTTAPKVGILSRVADAYGGLAWLSARDDVDPQRVLVMGFSNGGSTGLSAVWKGYAPKDAPESLRFRAAVLFYPWCVAANMAASIRIERPTLVVIGEEDDWTPARACARMAQSYKGPLTVRTHVIPDATHSFDLSVWRGQPIGERTYLGHFMKPDEAAVAEAERAIEAFLSEEGLPDAPRPAE